MRKEVHHVPLPSSAADGAPEDCLRRLPQMSTTRERDGLKLLFLLLSLALCCLSILLFIIHAQFEFTSTCSFFFRI